MTGVIQSYWFNNRLVTTLGYRYGDYNTAGGVDTYKILGDWTVNDWIRFMFNYIHVDVDRVTHGAPSRFERRLAQDPRELAAV